MTETDPMTPGEAPPPPPPVTPASTLPKGFSVASLIGGLLLSLCVGAVGNIFSGLLGASTNSKLLAFAIGIIPGAFFALMAWPAPKTGFAQGLLVGGCIVALIGGACGASMAGATFH